MSESSDWAVLRLAKTLSSKFDSDWRNLSSARRRTWAARMLAAVVASVAVLYGGIALLHVATAGTYRLAWEENVLRTIEAAPMRFGTAVWFQTFGADFMLAFVVLTTAALAIWRDRPLLAVTIVMSLIVMDAIVRIGWFSLARTRPDIIAQGLASPGFHSFPSGHTSKTLAVYGLLAAQWFRASRSAIEKILIVVLLTLIALVVPLGRLRMGVHWPTDVIGGLLIGVVWLAATLHAFRPAPAPRSTHEETGRPAAGMEPTQSVP